MWYETEGEIDERKGRPTGRPFRSSISIIAHPQTQKIIWKSKYVPTI